MTTEKAQFAGVLSQVIPVAILAVVVEARNGHLTRAAAAQGSGTPTVPVPAGVAPPAGSTSSAGTLARPPLARRLWDAAWRFVTGHPTPTDTDIARGLRWETGVIAALVFIEMSALITAAGSDNLVLNWLAGRPGAVGVGVLLVLVGQLYIDSITGTYRNAGTLTPAQAASIERLARILLRLTIVAAVTAVILFYTGIY